MSESEKGRKSTEEHHLKVLVMMERIEGKIDRMSDRIKHTENQSEALLDVVTGARSGAKQGLVVRVIDLEERTRRNEAALERLGGINTRIDSMDKKLDNVLRMQLDHPPLLYLLRFQTRKTVMWIIVILLLLSVYYVSGLRQPILEFLGLPVF